MAKFQDLPGWKQALIICGSITGFFTLSALLTPDRREVPPVERSSPSPTPGISSTPASVLYLAVSSNRPTPEDAIPVGDKAIIRQVVDAAIARDRAAYNQLVASSRVSLVKGGTMVQLIATDADLVQVRLFGTQETAWTSKRFLQTTTIDYPPKN